MESPKNKMLDTDELRQKRGKKVGQSFYVPQYGMSVQADTLEEAIEKARKAYEEKQ